MKKSHLNYIKPVYQSFLLFGLCLGIASCGSGQDKQKEDIPTQVDTGSNQGQAKKKFIVFFGNSLTAGYGLEDPSEAFAGLIQKRLDSLGYAYKVINAGVSGETTAGGNGRIDWLLKQPVDIFILELGGNDGLRGIPVADTRKNLQAILDKVKIKYPNATRILAGMQIPPNMGQDYTRAFRKVYPDLAAQNDIAIIPFLLEGVGGEPDLNLPDGIHPNVAGHKIVAENVWQVLESQLDK